MKRFLFMVGLAAVLLCPLGAHAIGFDPMGAQEAAGLSREFDDATRLRQMQEPAQPLVDAGALPLTDTRPEAPRSAKEAEGDGSALVRAAKPTHDATAARNLQEAEHQRRRKEGGGFWHTVWQFALWTVVGAALTWGAWSWMVRRASSNVNLP